MTILLSLFKIFFRIIYFFIKLIPTNKKKITFISRQSNNVSIDFKLLKDELQKKDSDLKIIVLCQVVPKSLLGKVKYVFHMFRQMYHIATSELVILDSYCIAISILKHKKTLKVIQIWHALGSLKKFGYSILDENEGRSSKVAKALKMHNNYDFVLTSSEVSKKYFKEVFNASEAKMVVLSLPRVDYLKSKTIEKENKKHFYGIYPECDNKKRNILYVPTMRINKKTDEYVDKLIKNVDLKKYNLILKFHDGKEIVYTENKNYSDINSGFTGLMLLHIADYIITDYSAIVYEASIINKPIYFYCFDYDDYKDNRGMYIDYKKEMPGLISKNICDILKEIDLGKYNVKKSQDFCHKYIDNLENCTQKLVEFIITNMN